MPDGILHEKKGYGVGRETTKYHNPDRYILHGGGGGEGGAMPLPLLCG